MDVDCLFGGAEGFFDGPASGVGDANFLGDHGDVRADEEVIRFFAFRVTADDQENWFS